MVDAENGQGGLVQPAKKIRPGLVELMTLAALAVMFLAVLLGVIDRFALGLGLSWPQELASFMLVWSSLLAMVVAAKHHAHFQLTLLLDRLGWRAAALIDLASVFSLLLVTYYGVQFAWVFRRQISPALHWPMSTVYAAVPVATLLMAGCLARDMILRLKDVRSAKREA